MTGRTNHLLIAVAPTPNGRLHLGHIGAQFLKLDVLKRHALRMGDQAMYCFSLDTLDTPIHILAQQQGRSEADVCRENIAGIREDLAHVAIDYDLLLDTSEGEGRETIRAAAVEVDRMVAAGKIPVTEKVAHSRATGKQLVGRMLAGECPLCGRTIRGYACDPCGLFLSEIEQIRNLRAADPAVTLELRTVTNWFVEADTSAIRDYHDSLALPAVTRRKLDEAAALMLTGDRFRTRWTATVPYGVGTGEPGQVYFNYMLISLAEQYAFGELARKRMGLDHHPFEPGADAVTTLAYGVDNLAVFLIDNVAQVLATGRFRPFHHQLVSEFYTVDGEKISASTPNAMWVADAATLPGYSRDALRGYLLSVATPDVEVDIAIPALRAFMARLTDRIADIIAAASVRPPSVVDREILALAGKSVDKQAAALTLPHLDLPTLWQVTEEWLDRACAAGAGDRYSVLAGFAVVAAPALPGAARTIWQRLGLPGEPDLAALGRLVHDGQ
jgi:methionyl-tRNA synthetase